MSGDLFLDIQQAFKDRLILDEFFGNIQIELESKGDIISRMSTILGKQGLGILITTPSAFVSNPDVPGPYLDTINVTVQVFENIPLNRADQGTQKTAGCTAARVSAVLHQHQPAGLGLIIAAQDVHITSQIEENLIEVWDVRFVTHAGLQLA